MRIVDIHDAKTNLSKLIEGAVAGGEGFVIARAGEPLVNVVPLQQRQAAASSRIGFMKGRIDVPAAFDDLGRQQIETMFDRRR